MRYLTKVMERDGSFYYENPSDADNVLIAFRNRGGELSVAVAEEQAMDSYNHTFECTAYLSREDAERLRDYLNENFPKS
jgi:hypothetical protein